LCDLDDPKALFDRNLKPSVVISKQRAVTQAWALTIFQERRWSGISWWSFYDPENAAVGIWTIESAEVLATQELRVGSAEFKDAALLLNRSMKA
jgi:hypothetical protein